MPTPAAVFDSSLERWRAEQRMPWSQIKYTVTQTNLRRHVAGDTLRVLDAGGGNGLDSIPLAVAGHHVTIVDYSAEMLTDAMHNAIALGAQDRVTTHQAELQSLPLLFPEPSFDLILCHNVLQYVDDVPALLVALATTLRPGGLLSLVSVNRHALPYMATFWRGDPAEAYAKLDQRSETAVIFGATMTQYTAEEIVALLPTASCTEAHDYGLLCVCGYWTDNERKFDPTIFEQLETLELALTDRHPYKLLARYFQIIARKQPNP